MILALSWSSSSPPFLPLPVISLSVLNLSSPFIESRFESLSTGFVLFGLLSSSASLISASFSVSTPVKAASIFTVTSTVVEAPAAIVAILLFNVATPALLVQSASFNDIPFGK